MRCASERGRAKASGRPDVLVGAPGLHVVDEDIVAQNIAVHVGPIQRRGRRLRLVELARLFECAWLRGVDHDDAC